MNTTAVVLPIGPEDILKLEKFVRDRDPFLTAALDTTDPYSLLDYAEAAQYGTFQIYALFDRNFITRVVYLAKGDVIDPKNPNADTYRLVAGCMVYLIIGKALIESVVSLYEYADQHGSDEARIQLFRFRIGDNVDPKAWLEVALGRADRLDRSALATACSLVATNPSSDLTCDFSTKLSDLTKHRLSLTMIVLLERSKLTRIQKICQFFQWCDEDTFFNGIATTFAFIYFGQNRPNGMLKYAKSEFYDKCLKGIRNSAWDFAYLSFWLRKARVYNKKIGWIFCTQDKSLLKIGRHLISPPDEESKKHALKAILNENYNSYEAKKIEEYYFALESHIKSDPQDRKAEIANRPTNETLLAEIELELQKTFN